MPDLPPNFRPDAFAGVADDYVRYRLPYPAALLDDLLARAQLPPSARLLDLACGPGRVALAITEPFTEIWAVDQEPAMVAAGEREAARQGVRHLRWSVARAEDFEAPAAHFDLVTCGEAFHRLDQPLIAAKVFGWLKPGGAFATLGFGPLTTPGQAPWRRALADIVRAYAGEPVQRLQGAPNPTLAGAIADERAVLRAAGFADVSDHELHFPHEWTLEALLGNLRSTSVLSRAALGARHGPFEAELAAALLVREPAGRFAELVRCGYTLARKP